MDSNNPERRVIWALPQCNHSEAWRHQPDNSRISVHVPFNDVLICRAGKDLEAYPHPAERVHTSDRSLPGRCFNQSVRLHRYSCRDATGSTSGSINCGHTDASSEQKVAYVTR